MGEKRLQREHSKCIVKNSRVQRSRGPSVNSLIRPRRASEPWSGFLVCFSVPEKKSLGDDEPGGKLSPNHLHRTDGKPERAEAGGALASSLQGAGVDEDASALQRCGKYCVLYVQRLAAGVNGGM